MWWKKSLCKLLVGKRKPPEGQKLELIVLSGQYALLSMLLFLCYIAIAFFAGFLPVVPVLFSAAFLLFISLYLHRAGQPKWANYVLLGTLSLTIYLVSSSEPASTGASIHFVTATLAGFVMAGYRQRILAIIFGIFNFALFADVCLSYTSIVPWRNYSEDIILLHQVINLSVAMIFSVAGVYVLIRSNYHTALQLNTNTSLLQKANTELDKFVYSTSHDLRAPLMSILGLINIAERSNDVAELKQYMGMMKDRVNALDNSIKEIADYSRNNRLSVDRQRINLVALANEVWDIFKFSSEVNQINFQLEIPENLEVESDKTRLKTILSNLIANAIRYQDFRKENKYIRLRYQLNGKSFYIKVEDNGQGISPEYQPKIFDMFYRGSETSRGSGLGLYIVKETLAKLSGSIHLESAPGIGSTFTVRLPY